MERFKKLVVAQLNKPPPDTDLFGQFLYGCYIALVIGLILLGLAVSSQW